MALAREARQTASVWVVSHGPGPDGGFTGRVELLDVDGTVLWSENSPTFRKGRDPANKARVATETIFTNVSEGFRLTKIPVRRETCGIGVPEAAAGTLPGP